MPYRWNDTHDELTLWPHRSLSAGGFVLFIGITAVLALVPLLVFLGSMLMWGILPFFVIAIGGTMALIRRSWRDGEITETLTISDTETQLHRDNPRTPAQDWACNTYWVRVKMHETNPRVPHYVTLSGNGREVEIGAFLTPEEREELHDDLQTAFNDARRAI
ncbi:MAG: DUF2244 domain-containing protein [Shimia sp.]